MRLTILRFAKRVTIRISKNDRREDADGVACSDVTHLLGGGIVDYVKFIFYQNADLPNRPSFYGNFVPFRNNV